MSQSAPARYCGRLFTAKEIELITRLISGTTKPNRAQLSRLVCDELRWFRLDGRRKDMACRVAMLRMHRDGLISLPAPLKGNSNGRIRPKSTAACDPCALLEIPAGDFGELRFLPVDTPHDSARWNELIERYHYLGYKPLPGAQLRYLVFGGEHLLAALGFGAAAWAVAPRDRFIGWTAGQRRRNLHLVINNARFLVLPWIKSPNLASRILGAAARRIAGDWQERYKYSPALLETFVEKERFRGTCYRAANWTLVGATLGRGKLDRYNKWSLPVKDIFLYPLVKDFRSKLCLKE
ncbi:MAG: hypothetical protein COX65_06385 [Elusimicrobia bacterium CG_4_10_14_0_2_um_filter_56_8]|nr:MAG: hypothetical protein COX65_06385 [Elusimicrobia bacterium CG_4_10_14_0_2_um_filter_56_8]